MSNNLNAIHLIVACVFLLGNAEKSSAEVITITNPGFEDTTGQLVFNEFTRGIPTGWSQYNPNGLQGGFLSNEYWIGTLEPNGTDFFTTTAPEGNLVGILYNEIDEGNGEYGFSQTLSDTLQANTRYELSVEVGNIASGTASGGATFNLDGFPGYRVDLLAGGVVIAQDNDSLVIPEGEFLTSTVTLDVGASHAQLGQTLGIRLVNLNIIPPGYVDAPLTALEVDFDDVVLNTTAIPEPSTYAMLFLAGICGLLYSRRKHQVTSSC